MHDSNSMKYQKTIPRTGLLSKPKFVIWLMTNENRVAKFNQLFTLIEEIKFLFFKVIKIIGEGLLRKTQTGRRPRRVDFPGQVFEHCIETGIKSPYKKLLCFYISPSSFDLKDGSLIRHYINISLRTGTIPTLEALTPVKIDGCEIFVESIYDEYYPSSSLPYGRIIKEARKNNQKVVICLSGIQSNQYPRAMDIAAKIKRMGIDAGIARKIDILFGGYHVRSNHPESRLEVMGAGFSWCAVEAESSHSGLAKILTDIVHDELRSEYFQNGERPDINRSPMPFYKNSKGTVPVAIQASRGCPFNCNFCAVCQIDGNKMRTHDIKAIKNTFISLWEQKRKDVFLCDDGFYNNPDKINILDMLISLSNKGMKFRIMIQCSLDVKDEKFAKKCRQAGVNVVYVGLESHSVEVLRGMNKKRNVSDIPANLSKDQQQHLFEIKIKSQVEAWQKNGIAVIGMCILGTEKDQRGLGKQMAEFAKNIGVDGISPTMFVPLPGSEMEQKLRQDPNLAEVKWNLNGINTIDPTVNWKSWGITFEGMESWLKKEYDDLVNGFYTKENIYKGTNVAATRYYFFHWICHALGSHIMNPNFLRRRKTEWSDVAVFRENLHKCVAYSQENRKEILNFETVTREKIN